MGAFADEGKTSHKNKLKSVTRNSNLRWASRSALTTRAYTYMEADFEAVIVCTKKSQAFLPRCVTVKPYVLRTAMWISHVSEMTQAPGQAGDHEGKARRTRVGAGAIDISSGAPQCSDTDLNTTTTSTKSPKLTSPPSSSSLITTYERCYSYSTS